MERIGIYGGTFSPPHLGHVRAARLFLEQVKPDRLLIIPDCLPPHKEPDAGATDADRLAMCRLAFSGLARTEISDMEIRRGGKSYTAQTLRALHTPQRELFLLCGTDMFLTLPEWFDPPTIFSLCTPCCVRRERERENAERIRCAQREYLVCYGRRCLLLDGDITEVSSGELRMALRTQPQRARSMLPEGVYEYIAEKRLYGI